MYTHTYIYLYIICSTGNLRTAYIALFSLGTSAPNISEESTNGAQPLDCIGGFVGWTVPTYPTLAKETQNEHR